MTYQLLPLLIQILQQIYSIFQYAIIDSFRIDSTIIVSKLAKNFLSDEQAAALKSYHGKTFRHKIDFEKFLVKAQIEFVPTGNKLVDKQIEENKLIIESTLRISAKNK
jgi:hypothetical protein